MTSMQVGIAFNPWAVTGIARYTRDLLLALGGLRSEHAGLAVEAFAPGSRDPRPAWLPDAVPYRAARLPGRARRLLWRLARPPVERLHALNGAELIHTVNPEPVHTRLPRVTTVHDVAWRHFKEQHGSWISREYAAAAERAILEADHICADSRATAQDLIDGGVSPAKITVAYLGVDDRFRREPAPSVEAVRAKYDLPEQFVLYVGLINFRKNAGALVRALQAMDDPPPLVLAGPPPPEGLSYWGVDRVASRHLGFVPDEEIPALYRAAAMLVFPSLAEGFGLPLLEAMAAGAPVAASRIPVFTEIAGDVPAYFDPGDVGSLKTAVERLLRDRELQLRMREQGPRQAAAFTWEACAEATLHAYEAALE